MQLFKKLGEGLFVLAATLVAVVNVDAQGAPRYGAVNASALDPDKAVADAGKDAAKGIHHYYAVRGYSEEILCVPNELYFELFKTEDYVIIDQTTDNIRNNEVKKLNQRGRSYACAYNRELYRLSGAH